MIIHNQFERRPDPHPLDNDWRFTKSSTEKLVHFLSKKKNILLIGTPSVAYRLLELGLNFTLVDRQNIVGIPNQINLDVGVSYPPEGAYDAVVIDAPWYEHELLRWISWASQVIESKSDIYITLYYANTRPEAKEERNRVFDWLRLWSKYDLIKGFLTYESPYFEHIAKKFNVDFSAEKSGFVEIWLL